MGVLAQASSSLSLGHIFVPTVSLFHTPHVHIQIIQDPRHVPGSAASEGAFRPLRPPPSEPRQVLLLRGRRPSSRVSETPQGGGS